MKIALAIICKGTSEEAELLDRCLENMSPFVDGIFITYTGGKNTADSIPDLCLEVAKKYNANVSYFEWVYDFAAARNFNFSQVPTDFDWILWSDTDDLWRNLDKLRPTIEKHPSYDGFGILYLYDWDEFKKPIVVHKKTMVVKNDGCMKWVGALHEDLAPQRQTEVEFIEGIERCHISTKERAEESGKRNVEIAKRDAAAHKDDPRSFWNLGNALHQIAKWDEARAAFQTFLTSTESDDERYIAYQRLADIEKALGRRDEAIRQLQHAIGLFPRLPDAYFQLGYLFYSYDNLDKAEEYLIQGMMLRPQVHKMIAYNPRDYDYNPMMLLAKVYYKLNRPDMMLTLLEGCLKIYPTDENLKKMVKDGKSEKKLLGEALTAFEELKKIKGPKKLKAALDKLPLHLKSHPGIASLRNENFIKTSSTGKDLVYYCGMTVHEWYDGAPGFIGGSEEAVINLSKELAMRGWNVTIYNNCGHIGRTVHYPHREGLSGKFKDVAVNYRPFWEFNYRDKQDAVILWRWVKPLDAPINAPKIFLDLHDVVQDGEFTAPRLARLTCAFVKSKFHRSFVPSIPDDKIAVVPNGVDLSLFKKVKKDPMLMLNTSSPDRSMDVLPKLFEQVKKEVPRARLVHVYGWEIYKNTNKGDAKKMQWMTDTRREMKRVGIEEKGRVNQKEVAELYSKASILAYPTEFAEIDCISVRKAQIAGCYPITTDFGALAESVHFGVTVHSEKDKDSWCAPYQFTFGLEDAKAQQEWVRAAVSALKNGVQEMPAREKWAEQFSWDAIARRWEFALLSTPTIS